MVLKPSNVAVHNERRAREDALKSNEWHRLGRGPTPDGFRDAAMRLLNLRGREKRYVRALEICHEQALVRA